MVTVIQNVRVFDGSNVHEDTTVVIEGTKVTGIGVPIPSEATVIDGTGKTLLPGLIDAHTHTSFDDLRSALKFGVTMELEMGSHPMSPDRKQVAEDDTVADYRSAQASLTAPGGHPAELFKHFPADAFPPPAEDTAEGSVPNTGLSNISSPQAARDFVTAQVANGAHYIKFIIEEGTCCGEPGLPMMSMETLVAGIETAHQHGKMAIAHALTQQATEQALDAGIDGLAHLFMDRLISDEVLERIKAKGVFIVATACLASTNMDRQASIAKDERVLSRLPQAWKNCIGETCGLYSQGDFNNVLGTIKALHGAGVDVLIGTDASIPLPAMGGLAHGASVHHELQLFVQAGLSPLDALKAATSVTAKRFGLDDYGRIAQGLRADLLLVDGDPTMNIQDTLNISKVWKRGAQLDS